MVSSFKAILVQFLWIYSVLSVCCVVISSNQEFLPRNTRIARKKDEYLISG